MVRGILFGLGLLSGTILSQPALAEAARALQIVVSKDNQSMTVFDGSTAVKTTRVSTGKAGHTTPSGIFSILEKRKYHESNIYSNAPMPFMQRLTWSGIALHEGKVPNYPASHGCVRIPSGTAKELFDMTERGVHVIISDAAVAPVKTEHANLFKPLKPLPSAPLLSDVDLRPTALNESAEKTVEVAANDTAASDPITTGSLQTDISEEAPPLRILIQRRGLRETILDIQALLNELGFDAGTPDGLPGSLTRNAIEAFKRTKELPADGPLLTKEFTSALYKAAGKEEPPAGHIMVRQNFMPLFEAPVGIKDPGIALGTHFLTVGKIDRKAETAEWHAVTLENQMTPEEMKQLSIDPPEEASPPGSASAALDRIEIPADIRERIGTLMTNGTSLTITDQGLGPETGKGTDFITLTRSTPKVVERPKRASTSRALRSQRESRYSGIGLY